MPMTFKARITAYLDALLNIAYPDRNHRVGRDLASLYMWQEVGKYADDKYEEVLSRIEDSHKLANAPADSTTIVLESPSFQLQYRLTKPVKRLDTDVLAGILVREFNVSLDRADDLIEMARIPGNPRTTKTVISKK